MIKIKSTVNGYFPTHQSSEIGEINAGIKNTSTLFVYQINNATDNDFLRVIKKLKEIAIWHFDDTKTGYILDWVKLQKMSAGDFLKIKHD